MPVIENHFVERISLFRQITFSQMEESVQSLVCSKFRRNGNHQFRINDGKDRKEALKADT